RLEPMPWLASLVQRNPWLKGRGRRTCAAAARSLPLGLVEPKSIHAHDVVDAEVVFGIVTFDVVVPNVVDLLPADREDGGLFLEDLLGRADVGHALGWIHLAVDQRHQLVE